MTFPAACARPCSDCPWRRNALAGWLGPMDADEWTTIAHSEEPIACHQTIKEVGDDGNGTWDDPRIRQCQGAAIFRANVFKSPRDPSIARGPRDTDAVFASNAEFKEYHTLTAKRRAKRPAAPLPVLDLDEPCDGCGEAEAEWFCTNCESVQCNPCIDGYEGSRCPVCKADAWDNIENMNDPFDYGDDEFDEGDDL